jgi:hypothetical protein
MNCVFKISTRDKNEVALIQTLVDSGFKPEKIKSQIFVTVDTEENFWKMIDLEL